MKKILIFLMIFVLFLLFPFAIHADEIEKDITSSIENELEEFKDSLPKEIIDFLPDGIFDGNYSLLLEEIDGTI